jgi:hypothetical protein
MERAKALSAAVTSGPCEVDGWIDVTREDDSELLYCLTVGFLVRRGAAGGRYASADLMHRAV